jgi:hypothetical protein
VGVGNNLPCSATKIFPQYSSRGSPLYTDRAYADLGYLSNAGDWGWQPYNLVDSAAIPPDVIRVQFLMKVRRITFIVVFVGVSVTVRIECELV